jgi:uncharacterized protein YjbI with pentapeptide repeats
MKRTLFDHYRLGIQKLITLLGYTHPQIYEVLILQHRLIENLDNTLAYGETPMFRGERARILKRCDQISLTLADTSFIKLCELSEVTIWQNALTPRRDPLIDQENQSKLDAYLSVMKDLLLKQGLLFSEEDSEVRQSAQMHTLSALDGLNGKRKGEIVRFLYGMELIFANNPIISLVNANLQRVYLEGENLTWANFAGADLTEANLSWTNLSWADLSEAMLVGVDMAFAYLEKTHLRGANAQGANLFQADLDKAVYNGKTQWPKGFDPACKGALATEQGMP